MKLFAEVPCDPIPEEVGETYAEIKVAAQQQGTPLDECDLWIAATALTLDAVLVTSDADYQRIAAVGLRLEDWKNSQEGNISLPGISSHTSRQHLPNRFHLPL